MNVPVEYDDGAARAVNRPVKATLARATADTGRIQALPERTVGVHGWAMLATFGLIFVAELPDKTMMATLVLSSRYRWLPVLLGVSAAFVVQSAIAVAAGGLLGLMPDWIVLLVVALLFGLGAVLLLRESLASDDDDAAGARRNGLGFWATVFTSFGVLFAAEWGDASQLATAALAAHYGAPLSVFLGATLALVAVATLAVLLGRVVVRFVPLKWIQRGAAVLFASFAVIAMTQLLV